MIRYCNGMPRQPPIETQDEGMSFLLIFLRRPRAIPLAPNPHPGLRESRDIQQYCVLSDTIQNLRPSYLVKLKFYPFKLSENYAILIALSTSFYVALIANAQQICRGQVKRQQSLLPRLEFASLRLPSPWLCIRLEPYASINVSASLGHPRYPCPWPDPESDVLQTS